jgi:hypothetical protein
MNEPLRRRRKRLPPRGGAALLARAAALAALIYQGSCGAVRKAVMAIISTISAAETRNHISLTIGAGFLRLTYRQVNHARRQVETKNG